jgi:hypothetical protein
MKISRSKLRKIIQEAYRAEREVFYDAGEREEQDRIMAQMTSDDYDNEVDEYESRHLEAQEHMYLNALDALRSIIGKGIDSSALVGAIRKDRDLNFYSFSDVMDMIDSLEEKGLITGFLGQS